MTSSGPRETAAAGCRSRRRSRGSSTRATSNPAHGSPGRADFFVSGTGSKVSPCTAGTVFARIWDEAGLARPSDGRQPVPYDFRHHFAYACIERWRIQGKDVHAMLSHLSRYMGHVSFDSTYYYIHTAPDFLDAYDGITQASQDLLPEAGFG